MSGQLPTPAPAAPQQVTLHGTTVTCNHCGYSMHFIEGGTVPGKCPKCGFGDGKEEVIGAGTFEATCVKCGRQYGGSVADARKGCPYCARATAGHQ